MPKTASKKDEKKANKVTNASSLKQLIKATDIDVKRTNAARTTPDVPTRSGRPVEIDDLFNVVLPGDPQASPDGTRLIAPVLTIDRGADEYRTTLWDIPLDGGDPTPLTSGQWTDASPRWSPDGNWIAFTSNRQDKKPQIYILPVAGGEARKITSCENGVGEISWSPDSEHLAFTSNVEPEKKTDSDVKVITSARYKFDAKGFLGDKVSHIFTVSISHPDAEPVKLTSGHFNHGSPVWSPDGRQIAFVANRDAGWDMLRTNDIWTISAGGGEPRKITNGKGSWHAPAWSPDGTRIAALGQTNVKKERVSSSLYLLSLEGDKPERIGKKLDRTIGDSSMSGPNGAPGTPMRWLPDGSAIDALASDRGSTVVMRFPLDGKKPTQLTASGRHITAFDRLSDDQLVIAVTGPTTPAELHRVTRDDETVLTHFNATWLEGVAIPAPEEFWVESNGEVIQGWLIRPAGNTPESSPVPLILNIHGGPHAQFSSSWFHELQLYVARGNALVFINPRGSTGRRNDFATAVKGAWGIADMPDFMAAVDHVLSLGGLDENRLGVTGGSYGGFSTNWLLGHTDRFRAAVTDRSICNMVSMAGTDDISIPSLHPELGLPWKNTDAYWDISPLKYVGNVQTPCLIIHSEEDHRCPMEQAEQWFIALKVLGVPTEFVRFPGESHGLGRNGKPTHRVERLERTLEWFEKYL